MTPIEVIRIIRIIIILSVPVVMFCVYILFKRNLKWIILDVLIFSLIFLAICTDNSWMIIGGFIVTSVWLLAILYQYWWKEMPKLFIFGISIIVTWIIFLWFHENPSLLLGTATLALVVVTSFYAYLIYESNENMQKRERDRIEREEKRREYKKELEAQKKIEKINQLRFMFHTEIASNEGIIESLLDVIKFLKKDSKAKDFRLEPKTFFFHYDVYKAFIEKLSLLSSSEVEIIVVLYGLFDKINYLYESFARQYNISCEKEGSKTEKEFIISKLNSLEEDLLLTIKLTRCLSNFYIYKDFLKFEKEYMKIREEKIGAPKK